MRRAIAAEQRLSTQSNLEPLRLEIHYCLRASGRVTTIRPTTGRAAYENCPEPRLTLRRLSGAHDMSDSAFAVEYCKAVGVVGLRCTYEREHYIR
jgi:hypothetical protein